MKIVEDLILGADLETAGTLAKTWVKFKRGSLTEDQLPECLARAAQLGNVRRKVITSYHERRRAENV